MYRFLTIPVDLFVTLIQWLYFIFGFLFMFMPGLLLLYPFSSDKKTLFQKLTHYYMMGFFFLLKTLTPGLSFRIDDDAKKIRSSVVISNHLSYFDPMLLIAMFPRQKTIVKGIFFKVPFMGWLLKSSAYIPFVPENSYNGIIMNGIKDIEDFMSAGGNLFIFPEGKRSRDGRLGKFQKGAFSIALKYKLPLEVLYINNTGKTFTPGKFLVNTCTDNQITVERLGTIKPENISAHEMRKKALELYANRMKKEHISKNTNI